MGSLNFLIFSQKLQIPVMIITKKGRIMENSENIALLELIQELLTLPLKLVFRRRLNRKINNKLDPFSFDTTNFYFAV